MIVRLRERPVRVVAGGVKDRRPATLQRLVMTATSGIEESFLLAPDSQTDDKIDGRSGKLLVAIRYKKNVITPLPSPRKVNTRYLTIKDQKLFAV